MREEQLLELQRMESAVVRAEVEHPETLDPADVNRLRYLIGFARLTTFQPGAAEAGGPNGRAEVDAGPELDGLRSQVVDELRGPLRDEKDPPERLRRSAAALDSLLEPLAEERAGLLARHESDLSAAELDAEVGTKVLVNVAGGGGGAGFVYIGAYERLEQAGILPGYVIGSSIGALLGLFRAREAVGRWEEYVGIATGLDRRRLFSPVSIQRRYGLSGLLSLNLQASIGDAFLDDEGRPLRIRDLEIPYEAVVAGIRRPAFDRLPERFRRPTTDPEAAPKARRSIGGIAPAVVAQMFQVAAFFDPRVAKPIVLGEGQTDDCNAIDAAGFSAAIPGVLHYDVAEDDEHMSDLLTDLFDREEIAALVDGGVVANVPAELAWRRVQDGKLGTRNALYLAFDCFHPRWDPANLWLRPITQAINIQMTTNARYADWIIRFDPTLSPVALVPEPDRLDEAIGWGRAAIEDKLPLIERFLEPVGWDGG